MKAAAAALVLCLATCGDPPPLLPLQVPAELQVCPDATPPPKAPPPPRTVQQLVDWSFAVWGVLLQTESARNVCAARLDALNGWIAAHAIGKTPP